MAAAKRVLIVDDDRWFADLLAHGLRAAGFVVDIVGDAISGLARIDTHQPHLIVLDMFMPGPNGIVLLHELQSYSDLGQIPVVVCTNSAADISERDLLPYGVSRVLDKTTMAPDDVVAAAVRYA